MLEYLNNANPNNDIESLAKARNNFLQLMSLEGKKIRNHKQVKKKKIFEYINISKSNNLPPF